jgi:GNAT superfamily N-acetyltransferase
MSDRDLLDIDHLTDGQTRDLHDLYQVEWWTRGRTLDATRMMLLHTDKVFGICDKSSGRLVAFARVLSDRAFKAFIFDLIVAVDHRGEGLGTRLIRRIVEHPDLAAVRDFELACLPELTSYYERLGFTADVGGLRLMRRSGPERVRR